MFASRIFNLIFFHVVIWFGCNNLSTCNIVVACTVYVYVGISLEVWILLFAMVFTNLYISFSFFFFFFVLCCFFFYFFIIAGWAPKGELCSALCFQQNEQRQHVLCMLNCFLFSLLAFFKNSLFFRCILAISVGWPGYLTFVVAAMGILFSVVFFFLRRSVWPFMKSAKSRWTLPPFFFVRPAFWVWGSCQILVLVSGRTSRRARTTGYGAGCVYMLWPTLLVNTLKRGRWTKGWGGFARCHLL